MGLYTGDIRTLVYDVYMYSLAGTPTNVGYLETEPDVQIEDILAAVKVSGLMETELDDMVVGTKVSGKLALKQPSLENIARQFPWFSGIAGTNQIAVAPATLGTKLYQYARKMAIHPRHLAFSGVGMDKTRDLTLLKVVWLRGHKLPVGIGKPAVLDVAFKAYPDQSQFPAIYYGWYGAQPDDYPPEA